MLSVWVLFLGLPCAVHGPVAETLEALDPSEAMFDPEMQGDHLGYNMGGAGMTGVGMKGNALEQYAQRLAAEEARLEEKRDVITYEYNRCAICQAISNNAAVELANVLQYKLKGTDLSLRITEKLEGMCDDEQLWSEYGTVDHKHRTLETRAVFNFLAGPNIPNAADGKLFEKVKDASITRRGERALFNTFSKMCHEHLFGGDLDEDELADVVKTAQLKSAKQGATATKKTFTPEQEALTRSLCTKICKRSGKRIDAVLKDQSLVKEEL